MIKLKDLILEQSFKWKRVSAGEYEVTTDAGTYRIERVGGRTEGTPIQWNVFGPGQSEADDAERTLAGAKWLIQQWDKNR